MQAAVKPADKPAAAAPAAPAVSRSAGRAFAVEVEVLPLLAMLCFAVLVYHGLDLRMWWTVAPPS